MYNSFLYSLSDKRKEREREREREGGGREFHYSRGYTRMRNPLLLLVYQKKNRIKPREKVQHSIGA